MTNLITITKYKIAAFLMVCLMAFVFVGLTHAEDSASPSPDTASSHGITFPVAELNNCANITECKAFCNIAANQTVCQSFARAHGLDRASQEAKQAALLADAKTDLGCDGKEACQQFCGLQENWVKCGDFARKHGMGGPPAHVQTNTNTADSAKKAELLAKAKEILGCDSMDSCKTFCQNPDNHQACEDFARQMGVGGGQHVPPGQLNVKPNVATSSGGRQLPENCRNLTQKMPNATQDQIKEYYLKNCVPSGAPSPTYQKPTHTPAPGTQGSSADRELRCKSYPGCSWTGDRCQCGIPPASGNTGTSSSVKGVSTENP